MAVSKTPQRLTMRELARKLTREETAARRAGFDDPHDLDELESAARTSRRRHRGLREGVARMLAEDLGIDPTLAVKAGEPATKTLGALKDAGDSADAAEKARHVRRAQKHIRAIDPAQHPKLLQQLQARLLAAQGRGGDTEVAHLTPGEIVIPPAMQTPELLASLEWIAAGLGIDVNRLRVGDGANSVNPRTGTAEFRNPYFRGDPRNPESPLLQDHAGFGTGGWPDMGATNVFANNGINLRGGDITGLSQLGNPSETNPSVTNTNRVGRPIPEGIEIIEALPPIWGPFSGLPSPTDRGIRVVGGESGNSDNKESSLHSTGQKINFLSASTEELDAFLAGKDRQYLMRLKMMLQRAATKVEQTGDTVAMGGLIIGLASMGSRNILGLVVGAAAGFTAGILTVQGWSLQNAVDRIDARLAEMEEK